MSNHNVNPNIKCTVHSCAYHHKKENYCSLHEIKVGVCIPEVTDASCTECSSFMPDTPSYP